MYLSSWSCWKAPCCQNHAWLIKRCQWLSGFCLPGNGRTVNRKANTQLHICLSVLPPQKKQYQFAQLTVDGLWCLLLVLDPVTLGFLSPFLLLIIHPLMVMSCYVPIRTDCIALRSASTSSSPDTPQGQAQQSHTETHHLLMRDGIPEDHWGGAYDGHILRPE